jgi:O-antigen chain-terminating methyltransferase
MNAQGDNKIDIEGIMNQIREAVRRKKELGIYTDADIQKVSGLGMDISSDKWDGLPSKMAFLLSNCDLRTGSYNITSNRPLIGRFIVTIKKLFLKTAIKIAAPIWEKNAGFNFHVVQALNLLVGEINNLKQQQESNARLLKEALEQLRDKPQETGNISALIADLLKNEDKDKG